MSTDPRNEPGMVLIGKGEGEFQYLNLKRANRHGLVTGATGTGKTVTLQTLAEGFSNAGVPVFAADVKGDLSGIAMPGEPKEHFTKRATELGFEWQPDEFPVVFWDLFGEQGHPIRATISEMGPLLLSRLHRGERRAGRRRQHRLPRRRRERPHPARPEGLQGDAAVHLRQPGRAAAEVRQRRPRDRRRDPAAIAGAGEPGRRPLLRRAARSTCRTSSAPSAGRGVINILAADKLMRSPRLYATFLLWMLSELFETLPEVGDPDKPKLVFFFDEAHLLFDSAPKALLDAIEQVVRLIRSKGVGVYFVTQNPLDVPETVLGQLGNRVQHALRAFTPRDQKAVRAAAETFRQRKGFDTATAITELKVGEALVSTLDLKGAPVRSGAHVHRAAGRARRPDHAKPSAAR